MDPLILPAWLTLLIVVLASARLFRLIATDEITEPLRRRIKDEISEAPKPWRGTLMFFLSCPWCMGMWVALGAMATTLAWSDTAAWQIVAGALAVNYLAAHMNVRQDMDEPIVAADPEFATDDEIEAA